MMLLESPPATAGVVAWKAWAKQLNELPISKANDQSVKLAKARAEKMVRLMTQFPNGVSAKDPNFRNLVREFSK